jgi:TusA-related sulfurtransferase
MTPQFARQDFACVHAASLLNSAENCISWGLTQIKESLSQVSQSAACQGAVGEFKDQMSAERILDVRGLEQPEPLLRALAELESLLPGDYIRMLSHRDPLLLYSMLESQGFSYTRCKDSGSVYEILIWRAGDVAAERAAHA